jgi:hypothetical protein
VTGEDVKALLDRIHQSGLPYREFEPAPLPEASAGQAPEPQSDRAPPAPAPTDFLSAYEPRPVPAPQGAVRLEELFARLAARGRRDDA